MKKSFLLIFFIVIFTSCGPEIKQFVSQQKDPLNKEASVVVLTTQESVPENAQKIGGINYIKSDENKIGFHTQLEYLEDKARSLGANLVKVNEVSTVSGNTFQLKADLYFSEGIEYLKQKDKRFGAKPESSVFYFYVQPSESLPEDGFSITINDTEIQVPTNEVFTFENNAKAIQIQLEDDQIEFNPQNGLAYFIRIKKPKAKRKAQFELVNPLQARLAIEAQLSKDNETSIIVYDDRSKKVLEDLDDIEVYPDTRPKNHREIHKMSFFMATGLAEKLQDFTNNRRVDYNAIQDELTRSFFINLGLSYYFDKHNGIGINYQYYNVNRSFELNNQLVLGSLRFNGNYEVERTINYFGLNYHRRFFIGKKDELILSAGPGYFFYSALNKDAETRNAPSTSDFAANIELNYNMYLFNNLFLHLTAGFFLGETSDIRSSYVDDDRLDTDFGLDPTNYSRSRAYIGIGLKYNFSID